MKFRQWLERTLYHGTVVDNLDSIRRYDLQGGVGDFVSSSYSELPEEELPELVFAADKGHVSVALGAMVHHIGKKLNKNFHDVTDRDIHNYGLLVIVRNGERHAQHRSEDDDNYYGRHPYTVEPGDYYAEELPAHVFLRGSVLMRFLRRLGLYPRNWGSGRNEKLMRGELIKWALHRHPERPKREIINKVMSLSFGEVEKYLRIYKSASLGNF